jgi:hypothetical protein
MFYERPFARPMSSDLINNNNFLISSVFKLLLYLIFYSIFEHLFYLKYQFNYICKIISHILFLVIK